MSSVLPPNIGPAASSVAYVGEWLQIGRFRCPADHPRWASDNYAHEHELAFARVPVGIAAAGASPVVADANAVMCYNANTVYRRRLLVARGDACEWFAVRTDVLADALVAADPAVRDRGPRLFARLQHPAPAAAYVRQRLITETLQRAAPVSDLWIEEQSLQLLGELFMPENQAPTPARARQAEQIEAALAYLGRTFAENAPIARIADAAELSLFHFCRVFRAHVGCTVHRYRLRLRVRAALELLAETDANVSEIAGELGFCDQCHFTNAFRREMQMTPAAFRRACRIGGWSARRIAKGEAWGVSRGTTCE